MEKVPMTAAGHAALEAELKRLTAEESVSVKLPPTDDAIDDPYVVFIHGYQTSGGATATTIQFDWQAVDDLGVETFAGFEDRLRLGVEVVLVDVANRIGFDSSADVGCHVNLPFISSRDSVFGCVAIFVGSGTLLRSVANRCLRAFVL